MRLEQLLLSAATAEPVCRNGDSTQTSRQIRVQNKIRTDYDSLKAQMMVNIKKKSSCWPPGPNLQPATCLPALTLRGALLPPPGHSGVVPTAAQDARAGAELLLVTAALRRLTASQDLHRAARVRSLSLITK